MAATTTTAFAPTETPAASVAPTSQRLMSLDALRGFDMFWIICAEAIVGALHRLAPIAPIRIVADQLEHAEWEGFHFEDLIFPLFVFMMGISVVFSLSRLIDQGGRAEAIKRVVRRFVLLFIVALIYSGGFSHEWPNIRLLGVLNRIALCYLFGGLLFVFLRWKGLVAVAVALLLGYWALMAWVPFPDVRPTPGGTQVITKMDPKDEDKPAFTNVSQLNMQSTTMIHGTYIQGVNLANYLDQKYLPGMKWDGTYDPEGYLSTMPAIVTCLLGILAGLFLRSPNYCDKWKVIYLISFGVGGVILGFLWGTQFPVIKKIWTSSYVLVAGGYSAILLGTFYYIVDVLKFQKWCQPFVRMGMNSITIYMTSNIIGGFTKLAARLAGGDVKNFLDNNVAQGMGSLVVALVGTLLVFWFLHFLYKRKIFLRL